jgi:hypothetical protein
VLISHPFFLSPVRFGSSDLGPVEVIRSRLSLKPRLHALGIAHSRCVDACLLRHIMSSPVGYGFSAWRPRRAPSVNSQDVQDEVQATPGTHIASPPRSTPFVGGDARLLSSSLSSTSHREPIRSFIHGSVRDHLGNGLSLQASCAHAPLHLLTTKSSPRRQRAVGPVRPSGHGRASQLLSL